MDMETDPKEPDVKLGLEYWAKIPASVDGVLGGFGTGMLPRVDSLGSRQFLLSFMPELCTVPSVLRKLDADIRPPTRRFRALDVGAGIGRVTSTVLLPLVDDVVLLEPVASFINEALRLSATWRNLQPGTTKSVTFLKGTLQAYKPSGSYMPKIKNLGRVGYTPPGPEGDDEQSGFDVIWCQWCLGHMDDWDLIQFFKESRAALRSAPIGSDRENGLIVVKENLCPDEEDGSAASAYDDLDASVTRSNQAWLGIFRDAGLTLVREQTQMGLQSGLYVVKMYALR